MSVKMYAGIEVRTGDVTNLIFVDEAGRIHGISIPVHSSEYSHLVTQWDTEEKMLSAWRDATLFSMVELKDFTVPTLLDALKEVALDQLEKHGEA